ncbi:MAG: hypothetical protein WBE09_16570 [Candidatus Acidiferrales bacterium]
MPYRPRELVVRAREAASLLLSALDRGELVERFLDIYAAEYRRPGRADSPGLYREQRETIRRESLLAMVLRVESALPARLKVRVTVREADRGAASKNRKLARGHRGAKKSPKKKDARKKHVLELAFPLLDLFREEFFVALGQALDWTDEEAQSFWRDLEIYGKLSAPAAAPRRATSSARSAGGPFVDRTALLLDPSLMEQARRAAAKFQLELHACADRVLRKAFSRRAS